MINNTTYTEAVKPFRQTPEQMEPIIERLQNPDTVHVLHGLIGMTTEIGEFMDNIKRHLIYGEKIDIENAIEEAGDIFYYMSLACDTLGFTMDDAMEHNYNKLSKRYPEGFSEEAGLARADKLT